MPRGTLGGTATGSSAARVDSSAYDFEWGEPDFDFGWGEPEPTEVMFGDPMLRLEQLADVERCVLLAPTPTHPKPNPDPNPTLTLTLTLTLPLTLTLTLTRYVLRAPTPRVQEAPPPPSPRERFVSTLDAFDAFLAAKEQARRETRRETRRGAAAEGRQGGRSALGLEGVWDTSKLLQDVQGRDTIQALLHPPAAPAAAPCKPKGKPRWVQSSPTPGLPRTGGRSLITDNRR